MSLDSQTDATTRASHWGITVNNPTADDFVSIRTQPRWLRKVKWQEEIGENGTRHIQAYANTDQTRMSALKEWLPRAHFKALLSKDHIANMVAYVHKEDTAIAGTQGEISYRDAAQALTMAQALMRIAEHAWSDAKIQLRTTPTELYKGQKIQDVYEEEYWDVVNQLLLDDENMVGLYTQPQYLRAWVKTRKTWVLKSQLDSQTRITVICPDGEISPVSV